MARIVRFGTISSRLDGVLVFQNFAVDTEGSMEHPVTLLVEAVIEVLQDELKTQRRRNTSSRLHWPRWMTDWNGSSWPHET